MSIEVNEYIILNKISSGAFGEIFVARNPYTKEDFAIKIEKSGQFKQLKYEFQVYKNLLRSSGSFIAKVYAFGKVKFNNDIVPALVMDLLGNSLEELFEICNRRFCFKTVLMLGELMLSRIEFLHYRHYIHRDIKPDNFAFGKKEKLKHNLFVLDFGLTKNYRNPTSYVHIPMKTGKSLVGTARYASLNTHLGIEQSRRDDLESICYCLIYFLKGRLPWQGLPGKTKEEKYNNIRNLKQRISAHELCEGLPDAFLKFLIYVRQLEFDEMPSYAYLRKLLNDEMKARGYSFDYMFDWVNLKL